MKYNFEVQWKQGTDDIIADALSKNPMYAAIQDYDDDDEVIFQNGIRKSNYHSKLRSTEARGSSEYRL